MSVPSLARFKCCTKCDCMKPATVEFFDPGPHYKLGLKSFCKTCRRLSRRQSYASNPEKELEYTRRYRAQNPEKVADAVRKWNESNPRFHYEYNKRWRSENLEYYRAYRLDYGRRYRKENLERVRLHTRIASTKRRSLIRSSEGSHTVAEVQQMYEDQGGLCAYCETVLLGNYEVDHMIPLSKGGRNDWTNLAIVCRRCNRTKHNKTVVEFFNQ